MARERDDFNKPTGTVIGKGLTIQAATLSGADSIRVEGTVVGNIELDGHLQLGDSGRIEGNVHVSSALIAGRLIGNTTCRSLFHLAPTAVINGDVITATLIVDEGAVLHGKCKTRSGAEPAPDPELV